MVEVSNARLVYALQLRQFSSPATLHRLPDPMSRKCTLTTTRISIAPTSCCGRGLRSIFDSHHALDSCRHWPLFHPDLDLLKKPCVALMRPNNMTFSYVRHLSPVAERGKTLSTNLLFRLRKGFQSAHVARSLTRSVPSGFWILGPWFLIITTLVHFFCNTHDASQHHHAASIAATDTPTILPCTNPRSSPGPTSVP